jgi:hypothetical protein
MSMQLDDFPHMLDRSLLPSVILLWFSLNDPTARRNTCPCRGRRSSDIIGRTDGRNVRVGFFALSVLAEWDWLHPNGRFRCGQLGRTELMRPKIARVRNKSLPLGYLKNPKFIKYYKTLKFQRGIYVSNSNAYNCYTE